jgi:hypothetical protein
MAFGAKANAGQIISSAVQIYARVLCASHDFDLAANA